MLPFPAAWVLLMCGAPILYETSRPNQSVSLNPYGFSIHQDVLNASSAALIQNAGAGWVRFQFQWRTLQPQADVAPRWSGVDRAVASANQAGLKVLFDIMMAPEWALKQACDPFRPHKKVLPGAAEFARFATLLAERYDGRQGRAYIDAFEVANEEFDNYWGGNWSSSIPCRQPQLYAPVLQQTYAAIKRVSPRTLVGFGGLWWLNEQHFRGYYQYLLRMIIIYAIYT